jgi:hypothetical protein
MHFHGKICGFQGSYSSLVDDHGFVSPLPSMPSRVGKILFCFVVVLFFDATFETKLITNLVKKMAPSKIRQIEKNYKKLQKWSF